MFNKLKLFIEWMNEKGVPIPFARYDKRPSVSLSLLVISAAFVMWSLVQTPVNWDRLWGSLMWHITSAVLYYNRSAKISKDGLELSSGSGDGEKGSDSGREKKNGTDSV